MGKWLDGDHGVTGKYSYLTGSIVNSDLKIPVLSIHSPPSNDMHQRFPVCCREFDYHWMR